MSKTIRGLIVALSCVGLLGGQVAHAANRISDVALQPGGLLKGQIVDGQGSATANARVAIVQQGEAVAVTKTNEEGRFAVNGLSAGVYEIHSQTATGVYRLWAPQTAPPSAQADMLLVEDGNVVRGQRGGGIFGNPWIWAAIAAAAIAIPLALDDDGS